MRNQAYVAAGTNGELSSDSASKPANDRARTEKMLRICHVLTCVTLFIQTLYLFDVIEIVIEPSSTLNRSVLLISLTSAAVILFLKFPLSVRVLRLAWPMLPIIIWYWTTSFWAAYPDLVRQRSIAFAVAYVSALGLAVGMRSPRGLQLTLVWTFCILILANFISLFFPSVSYSDIGIKGIHVNKNVAGFASIMGGAILAFAMPQLRSNAAKFIGIAIIILALVFLVLTKSKTNLFVLLVLVGMMPLYVLLVRRREAKRVHFIATCVVCGLFFLLGASGSKLAALGALYGDPTLTNRAVIWLEVEAFIAQSPWRGVGFGSFWDIGQEWNLFPVRYYVFYNDPLVVNLSHNGYVDILLHGGRIALVLAYIATAQIFCYTLAMATGHGVPRHHKWAFCMLHCLIIMIMVQNLTESSIFFPSSSASYFFLILLAHGVRWKAEFDTHKERVSRWARHTTQLNAPIR